MKKIKGKARKTAAPFGETAQPASRNGHPPNASSFPIVGVGASAGGLEVEELFNLIPGDMGRRLGEIRSNLEPDDLEHVARTTIEEAALQEREVRQKDGRWYMLRVRPYKTWENKVEGAVLSFQDIDGLKRTLSEAQTFAEAVIENAREPLLVLTEDLRVTRANPAFYRSFGVSQKETEGRLIYDLGNRQWDIPALRELFQKLNTRNARIDDFEVRHTFEHLGPRCMILNARRIEPREGSQIILLSIEDATGKEVKVADSTQVESGTTRTRVSGKIAPPTH